MLSEKEIKDIKEEAERLYPKPVATKIPDDYYDDEFCNRTMEMEMLQAAYIAGATSRAEKAKDLVKNIQEHIDNWGDKTLKVVSFVQQELATYNQK